MTMKQKEELLEHLAHIARKKYRLHVWQWLPGHVGSHAPGSLHGKTFPGSKTGRAFDAYGNFIQMARFARHCRRSHANQLLEGIHNSKFGSLSIKNGKKVPSSFWGLQTWLQHKGHVHVGV